MANKQRLIDANALSEKIGIMKFEITRNRGGYRYCNEEEKNEWDKLDSFDSLVCDAPIVDAVVVTRCKDCKSSDYSGCSDGMVYCMEHSCYMDENGYCSDGVRCDSK